MAKSRRTECIVYRCVFCTLKGKCVFGNHLNVVVVVVELSNLTERGRLFHSGRHREEPPITPLMSVPR